MNKPDDETRTWAGYPTRLYEGVTDPAYTLHSKDFPWLCENDGGLDVVVTALAERDRDEDAEFIQVGVDMNDLVTHFLFTEEILEDDEIQPRREQVIAGLKAAMERIENAPLPQKRKARQA